MTDPRRENSTNSHINPGTTDKNRNSKTNNIKIMSNSSASVATVCTCILHKNAELSKKNKQNTMAETFNTTFIVKIKLKLLKLNHNATI